MAKLSDKEAWERYIQLQELIPTRDELINMSKQEWEERRKLIKKAERILPKTIGFSTAIVKKKAD